MKLSILSLSILSTISVLVASAQSPMPIVVPAASPITATSSTSASGPQLQKKGSGAVEAAIKQLEQMKAANEDLLRKQETMLQQLDELQKAAEQLKMFSARS